MKLISLHDVYILWTIDRCDRSKNEGGNRESKESSWSCMRWNVFNDDAMCNVNIREVWEKIGIELGGKVHIACCVCNKTFVIDSLIRR